MRRARRGAIARRLYAVGVVQLTVVAIVAVVVFVANAPTHGGPRGPRDGDRIAAEIEPLVDRPAELAKELALLRDRRALEVSIYDEADRLLSTNVDPPLASRPPMEPPEAMRDDELLPGPPPESMMIAPLRVHGGRGLMIARHRDTPPTPIPPLVVFALGMLVVGLGSLLTARWIVAPLSSLAAASRALGSGDLRARTGLDRDDEIGELGATFDEMAARVETLVLAQKELLANVSHELRTPLARIRVALDLAAEGDAIEARASLEEIAIDLAELEALIDDVLTATRLEVAEGSVTAGFALHRAHVAASTICAQAADRFRARHARRPFMLDAAEDLPSVDVDPVLFRRVLDNLLDNAHKYSPDAATSVSLRAFERGGDVVFEVRDRGIGIAEDDRAKLFTPFFRADRSRSRAGGVGGIGLGLTLAKRIVEAHGGVVEIESVVGEGTIARVTIAAIA
jgi:signal transduction histidine kinase